MLSEVADGRLSNLNDTCSFALHVLVILDLASFHIYHWENLPIEKSLAHKAGGLNILLQIVCHAIWSYKRAIRFLLPLE